MTDKPIFVSHKCKIRIAVTKSWVGKITDQHRDSITVIINPCRIYFGYHGSSINKISEVKMMIIVVGHAEIGVRIVESSGINDSSPGQVMAKVSVVLEPRFKVIFQFCPGKNSSEMIDKLGQDLNVSDRTVSSS